MPKKSDTPASRPGDDMQKSQFGNRFARSLSLSGLFARSQPAQREDEPQSEGRTSGAEEPMAPGQKRSTLSAIKKTEKEDPTMALRRQTFSPAKSSEPGERLDALEEDMVAQRAELERMSLMLDKEIESIADIKYQIERLQMNLNKTQEQLSRSQVRFDASVKLFEHRVDQIYARILPVLAKQAGFLSSDMGAPPHYASETLSMEVSQEDRWRLENSGEFMHPGSFRAPLTPYGFRPNVGYAREADTHVEVMGRNRGIALFGPYKRLKIGRYRAIWKVLRSPDDPTGNVQAAFDVFTPTTDEVLASEALKSASRNLPSVSLSFQIGVELRNATFEFRVAQMSDVPFQIEGFELVLEAD